MYKFSEPVRPRLVSIADSEKDPKLILRKESLQISPPIWRELGEPEALLIGIDLANRAFKLTVVPSRVGYKTKAMVRTDGNIYGYSAFRGYNRTQHRSALKMLTKLPKGFYKPLGGNVFEYDVQTNKRFDIKSNTTN